MGNNEIDLLIQSEIREACNILREGGIILYPTDTIWGLGCDATNEKAVERIYGLKQRTDHKAMLVLLDDPARLNAYVSTIPDIAWDLIDVSDKPLTIIYSNAKNLAFNLLGEDGSVGIRITREIFSRTLCACLRKPIVSTSANISGLSFPGSFREIAEAIKKGVDYIVHYRQEETIQCQPSGIIKIDEGGIVKVIRE